MRKKSLVKARSRGARFIMQNNQIDMRRIIGALCLLWGKSLEKKLIVDFRRTYRNLKSEKRGIEMTTLIFYFYE